MPSVSTLDEVNVTIKRAKSQNFLNFSEREYLRRSQRYKTSAAPEAKTFKCRLTYYLTKTFFSFL